MRSFRSNKARATFLLFLIALALPGLLHYVSLAASSSSLRGLSIPEVKGPKGLKSFLGKTVEVVGIFVGDPVPLLVTDLKIVLMNMPRPEDQFLLLVGKGVKGLNPAKYGGAQLVLKGLLRKPSPKDPRYCQEEPAVLEVESFKVLKLLKPVYNPKRIPARKFEAFWTQFCKLRPKACELLNPDKYAVLISGGYDGSHNYARYWNDLACMYAILKHVYGYRDDHIYILYADGHNPDPTNVKARFLPARIIYLRAVFNELREKTRGTDTIFIHLNNHGSRGRRDSSGDEMDGYDEGLCLWHETIYDDEFADLLADVSGKKIIVMEQCFSGGFIRDLSEHNRIVISSSGEDEPSYGGLTDRNHNEFTYHFMAAVGWGYCLGNPTNADSNGDHKISLVEAFNYARQNDRAPEIPFYDDNGDGIPHSGSMPRGGDGGLGAVTML